MAELSGGLQPSLKGWCHIITNPKAEALAIIDHLSGIDTKNQMPLPG
jgi:hypothetical protein